MCSEGHVDSSNKVVEYVSCMFHTTRWLEDLGLSSNVEHDAVHMHVSVLRGVILLSQ